MPKHVWIAIPAYTGQIHLGTMRSILTDLLALDARGDVVTVFDECGNALLADARAVMVAKFLASEATDLVFVDADVCWEAGALLKLVDAPVDFVAGIYPQRKDPITYSVQWLDKKELWADPKTGLIEVAGVPAGFMRVTRSMLERMIAHYPETEFYVETLDDHKAYALFDPWRDGVMKFGEDYSFCRRWREMGGQVWMAPEIKLGHCGFKTFYGTIGEWLRSRSPIVEAA
jgi:hypothetical protein